MRRATFICHNVQHLAKSQYYKDELCKQGECHEINMIWNLFTKKIDGPLTDGYDHVFSFVNSSKYNKFVMPFTQQGRLFSLARLLPTYEDPGIEEAFYIFSDQMYFNIQLFDRLDKIANKKYSITLLDEGFGLYSGNIEHYRLTPGKLFKQLAGVHIPKDLYIGWDTRVTKIIAQHPELLPEHKKKNRIIEQEPNIWGDNLYWDNWMKENFDQSIRYFFDKKEVLYLGTCDSTLVYEDKIIKMLLEAFPGDDTVVKPHPRVSGEYIKRLAIKIDTITDEWLNSLPAELFVGYLCKPRILLTYCSSSLSSIAELFPDIMCCYLFGLFDKNSDSFTKLKQDEERLPNVKCIYSYGQLKEYSAAI